MITGIVIMILGLSTVAFGIYIRKNPASGWRMNVGWKVKGDSDPSDSYLESVKFSGTIAISAGALFTILGILPLL
ncbi:DUF6199 family natural product biosynthesis protein [Paenibacillus sp. FSL M7-1046]|jgi:hypothetical protein|uniref:DUF6199 family natural product biosynthesis protein n=1 Tax=Paenibacillus sp. FSL M7-1046 TaxID=2975315 RepID=UPI0030F72E17